MKYIKYIFIVLLIIYIVLFISYKNGYNETLINNKMVMTNEMIKEYENDIKNGIDVSKKSYINEKKDYSNKLTNTSLNISKKIINIIDYGIKKIFKTLNKIVNE